MLSFLVGGLILLVPSQSSLERPPRRLNPAAWVTPGDYPPIAIQRGDAGTVGLRTRVRADGRVDRCDVELSSGSLLLDVTTCTLVQERARYDPVRDAAGHPIVADDSVRFTWRIPETSAPAPSEGLAIDTPFQFAVEFNIEPSGMVEQCRISKNIGAVPESIVLEICQMFDRGIPAIKDETGTPRPSNLRFAVDYALR